MKGIIEYTADIDVPNIPGIPVVLSGTSQDFMIKIGFKGRIYKFKYSGFRWDETIDLNTLGVDVVA